MKLGSKKLKRTHVAGFTVKYCTKRYQFARDSRKYIKLYYPTRSATGGGMSGDIEARLSEGEPLPRVLEVFFCFVSALHRDAFHTPLPPPLRLRVGHGSRQALVLSPPTAGSEAYKYKAHTHTYIYI